MIVHKSNSLHVSIDNGGADETHASLFQVFYYLYELGFVQTFDCRRGKFLLSSTKGLLKS